MAKYLIDLNLPYYFSLWNSDEFIHLKDINEKFSDEEIWAYAEKNNLTIISKDCDFSNRILFKTPPPKVIHIKFGNLKMNDFFRVLTNLWMQIQELNNNYKLVNVYSDRVEGIN